MRDTIKKHDDFLPTEMDIDARSALFFVRARPTKFQNGGRYGITASKRTFRFAVHRNRAKRLLRDWIVYNEKHMRNDMDYIFIARYPILDASRNDGRRAMHKALLYIKRVHAKQTKQ